MNCLTEALGLALPGNGSVLATHADRKRLFVEAGHADRRPRHAATTSRTTRPCCRAAIASFEAFENAMTLDIAMGGSTNTVLHLLAAAHEGRGRLHHGRHRPPVAPRARALQGRAVGRRRAHGGRAPRRRHHGASWASSTAPGCSTPRPADRARADAWPTRWSAGTSARTRQRGGAARSTAPRPAACRRRSPSARTAATTSSTSTAQKGVIRDVEHAFRKDGGLAVLYGNLAAGRLHREDRGRRCHRS